MPAAEDRDAVHAIVAREVPEVANGSVELRGIAREPGRRTKLAVTSRTKDLDPVFACVGPEAARVNAITAALGGEPVDILPWSDSPDRMVRLALAPARVQSVEFDWLRHRAVAHVLPGQGDLTRDQDGLNTRLASALTGWAIAVVAGGDE